MNIFIGVYHKNVVTGIKYGKPQYNSFSQSLIVGVTALTSGTIACTLWGLFISKSTSQYPVPEYLRLPSKL